MSLFYDVKMLILVNYYCLYTCAWGCMYICMYCVCVCKYMWVYVCTRMCVCFFIIKKIIFSWYAIFMAIIKLYQIQNVSEYRLRSSVQFKGHHSFSLHLQVGLISEGRLLSMILFCFLYYLCDVIGNWFYCFACISCGECLMMGCINKKYKMNYWQILS